MTHEIGNLCKPFTFARAARLLSEHGQNVTTLRVDYGDVVLSREAGAQALDALLRAMPKLVSLDLRHDYFFEAPQSSAMHALMGHPICASLEVLRVCSHGHFYNDPHADPGTRAFLQHLGTHAKSLKHLEIDGLSFLNKGDGLDFVQQLVPLAPRLTSLAIGEGFVSIYPYMDKACYQRLAAATAKTPVVALRMNDRRRTARWFKNFAALRAAPLQTLRLPKHRFERLREADGWLVDAG